MGTDTPSFHPVTLNQMLLWIYYLLQYSITMKTVTIVWIFLLQDHKKFQLSLDHGSKVYNYQDISCSLYLEAGSNQQVCISLGIKYFLWYVISMHHTWVYNPFHIWTKCGNVTSVLVHWFYHTAKSWYIPMMPSLKIHESGNIHTFKAFSVLYF